ncbi:unnamed protein product [Ectocarpus sp. CCAP 1310/34]|nr:unnamed protein product [Ectocarpus sp. CCAP 1310/34]
MPTVMVADIGGTSSRFILYEALPEVQLVVGQKAPGALVFQKTYPNENVATFSFQVSSFLEDADLVEPPETACIAVAGPVIANRVVMTNRAWVIDGAEIEEMFSITSVRLVNDFVAAGYGLLTLDIDAECAMLQAGDRQEGAPIGCIGSGTGLGETFLTCPVGGEVYDAWPTEGGHSEMAPRDDLEYDLIKYIKKTHETNRVSVERVASGTGLVNVYNFLVETFPERVDKAVHEELQAAGDQKGAVISKNSTVPGSICEQVMEIWATHYGAEAGVMGLRCIPTGGLFIAGGMTHKNLRMLEARGEDSPFMKGFHDKGRVSGLLKAVPMYAVLVEDIGLRGAHFVAYRLYRRHHEDENKKHHLKKVVALSATSVLALAVVSAAVGAAVARAVFRRK